MALYYAAPFISMEALYGVDPLGSMKLTSDVKLTVSIKLGSPTFLNDQLYL